MKAKKVTGVISVEVYTDGKNNACVSLQQSGSGCALLAGALEVVKSFKTDFLLHTLVKTQEKAILTEFTKSPDTFSDVEEVEVADDFFEKKGGEDE